MNFMTAEYRASTPCVRVDPDALDNQARLASYAMINSFLTQQRILTDDLGLKPLPAMIYLTIAMASIQRFARRPALHRAYPGMAPLPAAERGAISRRALAEATGLPRETVRRVVNELIEAGYVADTGARGVTSVVSELAPEKTHRCIRTLAGELARLFEEMQRLELLVYR